MSTPDLTFRAVRGVLVSHALLRQMADMSSADLAVTLDELIAAPAGAVFTDENDK